MKQVTSDNHEVRVELDGFVYNFAEGVVEVLTSGF
jgi:acylphosphatase